MTQENYTLITNRGLTKHAADIASADDLVITHIAFGDADRVPNGAETALGNEVVRYAITSHGVVSGTANEMFFEVYVDEAEGPYTIREVGLFDEEGDLIAVGREGVPINKVTPASGRAQSFTYRMQVAFTRLDNVTVAIAPGALAYVPYERRVDTGFGLTGGGALADDLTLALDAAELDARYLGSNAVASGTGLAVGDDGEGGVAIDVEFASVEETEAGELIDKSTHPAGVKAAIDSAVAAAVGTHPHFFFGLM